MCEHLEGLDPLTPRLPPLLTKEAFIPSSANPWLRALIIRSSGIAAMRMSLDMTDMIIAFTTNRDITGGGENKLPEWANKPVVDHMSTCLGRSSVTAVANNHRKLFQLHLNFIITCHPAKSVILIVNTGVLIEIFLLIYYQN